MSELVDRITSRFEDARDAEAAAPMARYMRDQFAFLGIPTPARRALLRDATAGVRIDRRVLLLAVDDLWQRDAREYQYAACDLLVRNVKLLTSSDLAAVRELVTTASWWDTVDALAINVAGRIVLADRAGCDAVMDEWIEADDLWVARSAILHQNTWKAATDRHRLFAFCLRRAGDRDFFVRKAIGWALREYSKSAPDAVRAFIADHDAELSGLSKREGSRVLSRGR